MVRAPGSTRGDVSIWIYLLPIFAAFFYATMQVLTRKLAKTKASAMAFFIQITFVLFCGISGLIVGNGQFADGVQHPSLVLSYSCLDCPKRIAVRLLRQLRHLNMSYYTCPLCGAG